VIDRADCAGCTFSEAEILKDNTDDGPLRAGMQVLLPCPRCGTTPLDNAAWQAHTIAEQNAGMIRLLNNRAMPLFHWSPTARRGQIIRYGLRPSMRTTTHSGAWRAPFVCLADTPRWAWRLSGAQRSAPRVAWDLWQTWPDALTDPQVLSADHSNGVHEVRTEHRIYKRNLWLVGTREAPGA